jgi:ABC-2 type transport system permease protein
LRFWIAIGICSVSMALAVGGASSSSGLPSVLGMIAATFIVWSLLLGPQFLRQDFRQDISLGDVLKSYPLPGWQVALGELLAPATIMAALQWLLILVALILMLQFPPPGFRRTLLLAIGMSAALVLPVLDLITLQIPNAAVLLFPAWFQSGKDAPHGIEATGQRIILMLGQLLVFLLALVPAVVAWLVLFFLFKFMVGAAVAIVIASTAAAVVLAAEAAVGILFLGRAFDRFDVGEVAA